tara:strand:- start:55 stop:558 length:504 start_codon:yes stop_codon:yes gene_type:complete
MKNQFFRINPICEYGRSPIRVEAIEEYELFENFHKNSSIIKNNKLRAVKGMKWNDVIKFESSSHFIISKKLKETLEQNQITGIEFFPVEIKLRPRKKYFGFYLTHIAGPILNSEDASFGIAPIEFDENKWNGSDIFTLEETLLTLISKKTKEVIEEGKFTNLEIRPI